MSYEDPFPVGVGGFPPVRLASRKAEMMVNILGVAIHTKNTEKSICSRHVCAKARWFVYLALQGMGPLPWDSRESRASIIALEAMCGLVKSQQIPSDEKPKKLLEQFSLLLARLEQEGELNEEELKTAGLLQEFFLQIEQVGEEIDFSFPS